MEYKSLSKDKMLSGGWFYWSGGCLGEDKLECGIINLYSSCVLQEKRQLWQELENILKADPGRRWCLVGDYNAVRRLEERRGSGSVISTAEIQGFNDFIVDNNLVDLPLCGREFTCYSQSYRSVSRIDRFLITENWAQSWGNLQQTALKRNVSDHCAIVLHSAENDWGPKPFRVLDCWFEHPNFRNFVEQSWKGLSVEGWPGYRLKEKLKKLKHELRKWNSSIFGKIDKNLQEIEEALNELDLKSEHTPLTEEETWRKRNLTTEMWKQLKARQSILHQKSRSRWVKSGEANTGFFHRCINGRRASNSINGFYVDGKWNQEPKEIKEAAQNHFSSIFSESWKNRLVPHSIPFKTLTATDSESLVAPFTEEEIKKHCLELRWGKKSGSGWV